MSGDLPVVSPPPGRDGDAAVWGVLLAAGTSSRYGDRNKLLASADGEPLVRRAARTLVGADLTGVVVVVGHEAPRVRSALAPLGADVDVRENEAHADGQSTSVRVGVGHAADHGADAVVVGLGDMPAVSPATVEALVATHERTDRSALAAAHEGVRGNPVLFDARWFDALASVSGDVGGRGVLLGAADGALVETGDPGVRLDVDEPADLSAVESTE